MGTHKKRYRERGGLDNLILIGEPALTEGMVKVARLGENWQAQPELTWQVWPADLEVMAPDGSLAPAQFDPCRLEIPL